LGWGKKMNKLQLQHVWPQRKLWWVQSALWYWIDGTAPESFQVATAEKTVTSSECPVILNCWQRARVMSSRSVCDQKEHRDEPKGALLTPLSNP
jgi:hypothetical protein